MRRSCECHPALIWLAGCCVLVGLSAAPAEAFTTTLPSRTSRTSRTSTPRHPPSLSTIQTNIQENNDHSFVLYSSRGNGRQSASGTARSSRSKSPRGGDGQNGSGNNNNNNNNNKRRSPRHRRSQQEGDIKRQNAMKFNTQITQQTSAMGLLSFLASTKGVLTNVGGSGAMNSVNYSTSFNRIARHILYSSKDDPENNNRSKVLADPRFALLACSAAEALTEKKDSGVVDNVGNPFSFGAREVSNFVWSIAKLNISPPQKTLPLNIHENNDETLAQKAKQVRAMVYDVAKKRQAKQTVNPTAWVPALSELCGLLMDTLAFRASKKIPAKNFTLQELSNVMYALTVADRFNEETYLSIIKNFIKLSEDDDSIELRPQEWSNAMWSLATSSTYGRPAELLITRLNDLMGDNPDFVASFKPQELGNTAWAAAKIMSNKEGMSVQALAQKDLTYDELSGAALGILRTIAVEMTMRIENQTCDFRSQELSNTAWSFATVGFGLSVNQSLQENNRNDYLFLPSDTPDEDHEVMMSAMNAIAKYSKTIIHKFRSQELNNFAWTMARINYVDEELMDDITRQLAHPRRRLTVQDIGTSLWALANLGYDNEDAIRAAVSRIDGRMAEKCLPQELSNTIWALATMEILPKYPDAFDSSLVVDELRMSIQETRSDPVTFVFGLASRELMKRPHQFKSQELKDVIWGFSKIGMRHPQLFRFVAKYLTSDKDLLMSFNAQGLGNTAWAYAKQGQLGEETIRRCSKSNVKMSHMTGRLAVYTTIFLDIGEQTLRNLFRGIADADLRAHDNLSRLKPQDMSNTLWAFASLAMSYPVFLDAAHKQVKMRFASFNSGRRNSMTVFKSQEVTNALWGLATLGYSSAAGLVTELAPALVEMAKDEEGELSVASISKVFIRQELANIAWACAVFNEYPPELMKMLYLGLMGVGENEDSSYVTKVCADGGMHTSSMMSIVYLQTAMDLDNSNHASLSLPRDFPEAWDNGVSVGTGEDNGMMDSGLTLSTSKIQRDVSSAFERIGFHHEVEHVISIESLALDFGVQISPTQIEILSLDLANVESKIGIEVDGPAHFLSDISEDFDLDGSAREINGKIEYQFDWDGSAQNMNGPTVLKTRLLGRLGWRIINIPFWEWYQLKGDEAKQDQYCKSLLESLK